MNNKQNSMAKTYKQGVMNFKQKMSAKLRSVPKGKAKDAMRNTEIESAKKFFKK